MINPLQINDLHIKSFLKIILAVQFAVWGVIGLDAVGLQLPIIRQLICFIYLIFVPGILILRILKLHKLGNIETLLYTVGLSIATLMFTGLVMNTVYPFFSISRPITITPLVITISVSVLVLCILSYVRDKDFADPSFIDVEAVLSPPALFLCMIPFLAIFGTYLVNFHHNNILLMFLIVIIALIVILIAFDKFIPKELYPLAILVIAIAYLFSYSLINMYLPPWDIHQEYHLANLVTMNSFWDSTLPSSVNAMLDIVILAPIYSIVSSMDITWLLKIIYPLLFSLLPLGLYRVFQKQTDDRIAFLSCFFFVSQYTFLSEMPSLARQEIAEVFLVLLILLMIDKNMDKIKRSFLFIIFGVSLVVSHYGLSYIYTFCLLSVWLIFVLAKNPAMQKLGDDFHSKFGRNRDKLVFVGNQDFLKKEHITISSTLVLLFVVFTLTWYMYISSSSAFKSIVRIGDHITSTLFTDFLNPEAAQGLEYMLLEGVSPLHNVAKYIHLLIQFFILVGIITLLVKRKEMKFEREYAAFSYVNFGICLAAIGVPYFASSLNTSRLYHITLIFLAPFCVIGGITVFRWMSKVVKLPWTDQRARSSLKMLSIFLVIFLLFSSGFVYEVTKDHPASISLSQESIKKHGDAEARVLFYSSYLQEQDVFSARWSSKNIKPVDKIYADYIANEMVLVSYGGRMQAYTYLHAHDLNPETGIYKRSYIYLRCVNTVEGVVVDRGGKNWNTNEVLLSSGSTDKIYTNGCSRIYYYE